MSPKVTITDTGREGRVVYSEGPLRTINGYWEFGGNDVVTIVSMGSRDEWERAHGWAVERRAVILRFVANEVVRLRAPNCGAEFDVESGAILVRLGPGDPRATAVEGSAQAGSVAFVRRYSNLKAMLGIGVLVVAIIIGGMVWLGRETLTVEPASGVPLGECVRTSTHIASLLQATDPHLPNWSGRGGNETTSLSILLIPLDGSEPFVVPFAKGVEGNGYSLSRILGSDGRTLWFDCMGLHGVHLRERRLVTAEDLMAANPGVPPRWWEDARGMDIVDGKLHLINDDRSAAMDVDPDTWKAAPVTPKPSNERFHRHEPTDHLASGLITPLGTWFGLHAEEELDSDFQVGKWLRRVENAEDAKRERRFFRAELEPGSDTAYYRIRSIAPLNEKRYLNAAFLRSDAKSGPLLMAGPESVLMVHTDKPGLGGRLIVSRVDLDGKLLWSTETGLDRYYVAQVLPGSDSFAFVGTRPPVPNKLSEPFVVIVDNTTGRMTTHSLWR